MFNDTKYTKIYAKIVEKAKAEDRKKGFGAYFESHHIVPRSLGGDNKTDNLVLLTAKEHFVVHHLLTKMVDDKQDKVKMLHAFWRMCHAPQQMQRITVRVYDQIRQERGALLSETTKGANNHFFGKSHTTEAKQKMKDKAKGRNPHDYFPGKSYPAWNKGLTKDVSDGVRRNSEAKRGHKNPMYGISGQSHPNTRSYILLDSKQHQVGYVFHSRSEFNEYCRVNALPFNGLYKTVTGGFYSDKSKNHRYVRFNGWSLRPFES